MIKFDPNGQGFFDFAASEAIERLTLDQALAIVNFLYDVESEISNSLDGQHFTEQDFYAVRMGIDDRDNMRNAIREHIRRLRRELY